MPIATAPAIVDKLATAGQAYRRNHYHYVFYHWFKPCKCNALHYSVTAGRRTGLSQNEDEEQD